MAVTIKDVLTIFPGAKVVKMIPAKGVYDAEEKTG